VSSAKGSGRLSRHKLAAAANHRERQISKNWLAFEMVIQVSKKFPVAIETTANSVSGEQSKPTADAPCLRSLKSAPDTLWRSKQAECRDDYPALVYLSERLRVIKCRDGIQWVLQRKRSNGKNRWRGVAFCRTREALIRSAIYCGAPSVAALLVLPKTCEPSAGAPPPPHRT